MSIAGLEKLDVWCKARDFAVRVNKELLILLPLEEKWSLNQQLRRSSQSIPANTELHLGYVFFWHGKIFQAQAHGKKNVALQHA